MTFSLWLLDPSDADPPVYSGEGALPRGPRLVRTDTASGDALADADLIAGIQAGDKRVFEQLYRAHYTSLVHFAIAFLRADDAARDVVGDVFLNIWRRRTTWSPSQGVRAYLFGAVRNRAMNVRRNQDAERRRDIHVMTEERSGDGAWHGTAVQAPDAFIHDPEAPEAIWRVVDALPERARLVVQLRWREGLDFGEIAVILGITRASAHVLHSRAMAGLRERLERREE